MADLLAKVREILESPRHEGLEKLVNELSERQDSEEFGSANSLYDLCVSHFPNCLALKLLELYRFSPNRLVRSPSIYLLFETLNELRNRDLELSLVLLYEIKPLLISCLEMQESKKSDIVTLRRIVSCVAYDVMILDHDGWDQLADCILHLTATAPLKAFHVFLDLPLLYDLVIFRFMDNIQEQAYKVLHNPHQDRIHDWSLALQSALKMGIQLFDNVIRAELLNPILSNLELSARKLVDKGMEPFLIRGLYSLGSYLARDKLLYDYNRDQRLFVLSFLFKIKGLGTLTAEAISKIIRLLKESPSLEPPEELDPFWYDHLNTLSPLELLVIVEATDFEDERYRELAFIRLNDLLSHHSSGKAKIDISVMRQLQPLLISCLQEEEISDTKFEILVQVVNRVANEVFKFEDGKWDGLRDYFASESKRDFKKAVYLFKCLTMALKDEFVLPLFPDISTRLKSPGELLDDKRSWVLAITGAFCAIIHVIQIKSHAGIVKEFADKMICSVRELVERGTEDEFLSRAFRFIETTVRNQLGWYATTEYKFIKGLLWRLYAIKGMEMESKMVLWRINMRVERGVSKLFKELVDCEFDWLNQPLEA